MKQKQWLSHKVVNDFNDDHQKSIIIYKDSYDYLKQKEYLTEHSEHGSDYEEAVNFYRMINHTLFEMKKIFTDLFISYAAFRKAAASDDTIMKEFKKLPADFTLVREQFNSLVEGYETALKMFNKVLYL